MAFQFQLERTGTCVPGRSSVFVRSEAAPAVALAAEEHLRCVDLNEPHTLSLANDAVAVGHMVNSVDRRRGCLDRPGPLIRLLGWRKLRPGPASTEKGPARPSAAAPKDSITSLGLSPWACGPEWLSG
jgi:hypothetical protein